MSSLDNHHFVQGGRACRPGPLLPSNQRGLAQAERLGDLSPIRTSSRSRHGVFHSQLPQLVGVAQAPTMLSPAAKTTCQIFHGRPPFEARPCQISGSAERRATARSYFLLARTEALSDVVGHLKKSSNDWLRSRGPRFASFFWQAGFGAFSVSQSQVDDVRAYIRNQREHHRVKSFQEELREFFKAYGIEFDERYVWD